MKKIADNSKFIFMVGLWILIISKVYATDGLSGGTSVQVGYLGTVPVCNSGICY